MTATYALATLALRDLVIIGHLRVEPLILETQQEKSLVALLGTLVLHHMLHLRSGLQAMGNITKRRTCSL